MSCHLMEQYGANKPTIGDHPMVGRKHDINYNQNDSEPVENANMEVEEELCIDPDPPIQGYFTLAKWRQVAPNPSEPSSPCVVCEMSEARHRQCFELREEEESSAQSSDTSPSSAKSKDADQLELKSSEGKGDAGDGKDFAEFLFRTDIQRCEGFIHMLQATLKLAKQNHNKKTAKDMARALEEVVEVMHLIQ